MAMPSYLKLKGENSGEIKGSVTQEGRKDQILVLAVSHEIQSPRDVATGIASGKRLHKPIVITNELDKSTPHLYNLLVSNENITNLELMFYTSDTKTGKEKIHYTIELGNAHIASIVFRQPHIKVTDSKLFEYEEVAFTYQKITWTWNDGGIMAHDDWETPK